MPPISKLQSSRRSRVMLLLLPLALLSACETEQKIVRYKPFLSGLDNVETQTPAVQEQQPASAEGDDAETLQESLVIENPDGTKTLISKSGVQLMAHIRRTLEENDARTFVDQVLSELTRQEYYQRGLDPVEGFQTLKKNERDILLLFSRMPMGEHTPNVRMDPLGQNAFRVRLTGRVVATVGRYRGFDMILEKGHWRLRWFN